ncbi:MAG: nucleotidyltransferase [Tenericutes bacterium]|nr:nucleotidyltransferase [Mycoplasmatota bacterium]
MTLVIMAAGMGSRFGGLKQIEAVGPNGEFIIDYSIYDAIKAGFKKVVFIIKEENYEIFKETIGKRISNHIKVEYVFQNNNNVPVSIPNERVKPLGTAHAILCCKDVVHENFAIINADDFYGRDSYLKVKDFISNNKNDNEFTLIGYNAIDTITNNGSVKRGVCNVKDNYLVNLNESVINLENGKLNGKTLVDNKDIEVNNDTTVSMNMFGFTPKLFELLENDFKNFLNNNDLMTAEYLIPEEVNKYLRNGIVNVKVIKTTSKWYGITYKEDLQLIKDEIKKLISDGVYPENLWK